MANKALLKNDDENQLDLKRLTDAELAFIIYQAGVYLSEQDSDEMSALTVDSNESVSVGSASNTVFDQEVGTHSALTTTTITSNLYQRVNNDKNGNWSAGYSHADFHRPVYHELDTGNIKTYSSSEFDSFVDEKITPQLFNAASNNPGLYKIDTTGGAGWTLYKSAWFTDTRSLNGASSYSQDYNIYVRTSSTEPTQVKPLYLQSSTNLKSYSVDKIKKTFGEAVKHSIKRTNLGTYKITNGSAPTTGSWTSRGSFIDTKWTTQDLPYTRTSTRTSNQDYTHVFQGTYIHNYDTTYIGNYTGNFTGNYTGNFEGNYANEFTGDFVGNFTGNYTGNFIGDYTNEFTRDSTNVFTRESLSRTSIATSAVNYTRSRDSTYTRNSTAPFALDINYIRIRSSTFTRTSARESIRNSTAPFTRNSTNTFDGTNFTVPFLGNYIAAFERYPPSVAYYTTDLYIGGSSRTSLRNSIGVYSRTSVHVNQPYYNGFASPLSYSSYYTSAFVGDYIGNYVGDFNVGFYMGNYQADYLGTFEAEFIGDYNRDYVVTYIGDFVGDYARDYTGNYIGNFLGNYLTTFAGDYVGTSYYTGDFVGNYIRAFTGNYTNNFIGASYEGNYLGNFETAFVGNYSNNFTRDSTNTFTRDSTNNFTAISNNAFTRDSTSDFTRDSTADFSRTIAAGYAADYIGDYTADYTADYVGNFIGDYTAATIVDTSAIINTYTLWMRVG